MRQQTYAKIIADSISEGGHRVTSMEVCLHRWVLAELNTHRLLAGRNADDSFGHMEEFSRNSASSRAIPVGKQISKVENSPALPVSWPVEQKGMQGGADLGPDDKVLAEVTWREAADDMVIHARRLATLGVHKSVTNRLLEPFLMHTVVITATDWRGFWAQRCSPLAQPEIRVAAEMMKAAYDISTPESIPEGFWHLPYIDREDITVVRDSLVNPTKVNITKMLVAMSSARCARVSYETQGGGRDPVEDLSLYERLVTARPEHFSPLEHPCTPDADNVLDEAVLFADLDGYRQEMRIVRPRYGNFLGWRQLRFEVGG